MAENTISGSATTASAQPTGMRSQRLSFANVAAMTPSKHSAAGTTPTNNIESTAVNAGTNSSVPQSGGPVASGSSSPGLDESLSRMDIKPVPDVPDHELQAALQIRPRLDDEKTHLSFSSNKAPSLDGKSVASAMTFALDEKESIRPDDSASVKAAEDDDFNSGPASGAPNSRVGSEAGGRAFGNQFNEISERMGPRILHGITGLRRPVIGTAEELRRSQASAPIIANPTAAEIPRPDAIVAAPAPAYILPNAPDEKIIEAMETPKDRMFLLQLEQQVITFIRDTTEPVLSLPPCNSFYRLLAHRLGDYYALGHVLDNSQSAVQLHRTPHCQIRAPLASFENKATTPNGTTSVLPSMKIMRRADGSGEGRTVDSGTNTTENSLGPSKAASEADSEGQKISGLTSPAESTTTKDNKAATREQREAKYKEARDRIFADWKESEGGEVAQGDANNDASRASSTSGKKKTKKKNNDDSFDSRSTYNVYLNQRQVPVYDQTVPAMNFYSPYMQPNGTQMYPGGYQQPYGQQIPNMQQFPGYQMPQQPQMQMPGPTMYPTANGQQTYMPYGQQMPQPFYPTMQQLGPMNQHQSTMPSPASSNHSAQLARPQSQMSDQGWNQAGYQNPYQVYPSPQNQFPIQQQQSMVASMNQQTVPYQFGQLPYQQTAQGARPMHPIPGSYNRSTSYNNSPGRSAMDSNAFRASSNYPGTNMTGSFAPSQQPQFPSAQPLVPSFNNQHTSPRKVTPQSHTQGQSTLSKWGTPATLPPKPPPPAPTNHIGATVAGGVPQFQNGTYSKPTTSTTNTKAQAPAVASQ